MTTSSKTPHKLDNTPPQTPALGFYGADPADPEYQQDPYPGYFELRETQPVNLTPLGNWRLSRYDDCVRLLRHVPAGMRLADGGIPGQQANEDSAPPSFMLLQDGAPHTRLRKLVSRGFTPRAAQEWRPRIEAIAHDLVDQIPIGEETDLIARLALPLPATLICELMGVPAEDRDLFTRWTADATHGLVTVWGEASEDILKRVEEARNGLIGYFSRLIQSRRNQPGDDLIDVLIAAEEDGDRLSPEELMANCIGLLVAGFETTIGLIGNGLTTLIQHPAEFAKLKNRPELIESAVEECLRYCGPITETIRIMHEEAEFDGFVIPKNASVGVMTAAANRDPDHYENPEVFDIERWAKHPAPPPHLAFGGGAHFCLGAHLARLETQAAIGTFVQRFDEVELVNKQPEWGRSLFRVPGRVPVRLG